MRSVLRRIVMVASVLLLCAPYSEASAQIPGDRAFDRRGALAQYRAAALRDVLAVQHQWELAWNRRDAEVLASFYTEDATLLLGQEGPRRGRDEIETALRSFLPGVGAIQAWMSDFTVQEGSAVLLARYQYAVGSEGDQVSGSYVVVFERERRRWKIRLQMFRNEPQGKG